MRLGPPKSNKEPDIIDLEDKIMEAAWDLVEYPVLCCSNVNKCKRKQLALAVDWNSIAQEDRVTQPVTFRRDLCHFRPVQEVCLFETVFKNDYKEPQQFTFKTSRQTESSYEISIQDGVSISDKITLSLSLGENLPGGSLEKHVTFSSTVGNKLSLKENLTWGIDSQVTVGPGSSVLASLSVREAHVVVDLDIETTITVTSQSQTIPVRVLKKSTKQVIDTVRVCVEDVCDTSKKFIFDENTPNRFTYKTKALCQAVYGVEQYVVISALPSNVISGHGSVKIAELYEQETGSCAVDENIEQQHEHSNTAVSLLA